MGYSLRQHQARQNLMLGAIVVRNKLIPIRQGRKSRTPCCKGSGRRALAYFSGTRRLCS